ncbi:chlorophyllase/cutinase-like alpha/beta fold protein [Roseivirga sp.]|uniref:poly(ethylene terephthalate) hydrolase family protein n=1 Tax=Roseivirga sp. TaxID=1964215 RepID=UPI003B8D04D8
MKSLSFVDSTTITMLDFLKRLIGVITPPKGSELSENQLFWKGAFYGLLALSLLVTFMSGWFFRTGISPVLMGLGALIIGLVGFWIFRFVASLIHITINSLPTFVFSLILGTIAIFSLAKEMRFGWPSAIYNSSIAIAMLSFGLFAGSLYVLVKKKSSMKLFHIVTIVGAFAMAVLSVKSISDPGEDPYLIAFEQTPAPLLSSIGTSNPGSRGNYEFDFFTYGNGTDLRREEYKNVKYKTETVNASKIIPEWKGKKAKWRKRFWGFTSENFPLNGRVWMPKGEGTFPLILIVHGNHGMEHFSDPGYAYLGELLASRGFITVSVDENFINGTWSGDFRGKEMPARGWLLLKHLEQWKNWSADNSHPLFQKADLNNVMLMGHSRGGEAMPIALTYNKLSHFPDDASVKFDFNFGIKGVAAIAPTDARYFRRLELKDVNYFSVQGSYDSDEASFFGLRQYQRTSFSDSSDHFKAGLYVHLANHGQFNSIWGRRDGGPPYGWFLNTGPMMTGEDQRQIAKVYLGAYAEAVLHENKDYLPLFQNAAIGKDWLPDALLLNNYKDAGSNDIVTFDEDIDLTTGTPKGSSISGNNLEIWKEEPLKFRDGDLQGTTSAVIGWTNNDANYSVNLDSAISLEGFDALRLTLARGDHNALGLIEEDAKEPQDLNFTIRLTDSQGNTIKTTISQIKKISPRISVKYMKLDEMNSRFGNKWEATLETFVLPWDTFSGTQALSNIQKIEFLFDKTGSGVLILDEIGIQQ